MALNLAMSSVGMQLHMHHQMIYRQQQLALHHYQQEELTGPGCWPTMLSAPSAGPRLPGHVKVELENKKLWQQFHAETTEMIITKTGRRMFPSVQLSVSGLERRARYCVLLELAPASDRRHKYVGGGGGGGGDSAAPRGWTSAGPAEPQPATEHRLYVHPDSPATGSELMQHPISFSKLKLTNNVEHHSNVVLTSMHKYIPRIWIIRCDDVTNVRDLYNNPSSSFTFRETEFIAVTAYQNENITKLKIDNNPFAKGFRESGQSACKRKRQRGPGHEDPASSNSEVSHDEEEGNASSTDSEPAERADSPRRAKRPRLRGPEDEACGEAATPAPAAPAPGPPAQRPAQPRLHRPWTDGAEEGRAPPAPTAPTSYAELLPALPGLSPLQRLHLDYLAQPAPHYIVASELSRQMQQRFVAAMQHQQLQPLLDFRR